MAAPKWTKHDYEFYAQVIHNTPMNSDERYYLEQEFGAVFGQDNPNFSWERWNAAVHEGKLVRRGTAKYGHWSAMDYRMTARILNSPELSDLDTRVALISAFGAAFERDNPSFDWDKFRRAAGSPYASEPSGVYDTSPSVWRVGRRSEVRVRGHPRRMK